MLCHLLFIIFHVKNYSLRFIETWGFKCTRNQTLVGWPIIILHLSLLVAVQLLEPRLIQADIVRFNIVANMKRFECSVCTEELLITHMNIAGGWRFLLYNNLY